MIQTLGDMTKGEDETEKDAVGVFLADSCMYQRTYPDHVEQHGRKINLSGMEDWMNHLIFKGRRPSAPYVHGKNGICV